MQDRARRLRVWRVWETRHALKTRCSSVEREANLHVALWWRVVPQGVQLLTHVCVGGGVAHERLAVKEPHCHGRSLLTVLSQPFPPQDPLDRQQLSPGRNPGQLACVRQARCYSLQAAKRSTCHTCSSLDCSRALRKRWVALATSLTPILLTQPRQEESAVSSIRRVSLVFTRRHGREASRGEWRALIFQEVGGARVQVRAA
jgi:hypothetical protein